MSMFAALLLILSAILHAGWNFLGKKICPSPSFFLLANLIGCLSLSPLLLFYPSGLLHFPKSVWLLVVITGFFQAIYMWGLAGAYKNGAISVAYPLLRAIPVIFVLLFTTIFNQGEQLTPIALLGIIMIPTGCILIPMRSFSDLRLSCFTNLSCMFAALSALGTIGYTLIDNRALLILKTTQELEFSVAKITLLYIFVETVSCALWLLLIIVPNRQGRKNLKDNISNNFTEACVAGITMMLTYSLVLASMTFVDNVSYVVAFRQLSIPVTVLLGIYLLKESAGFPKLLGTVLIFSGITLIGLGSN